MDQHEISVSEQYGSVWNANVRAPMWIHRQCQYRTKVNYHFWTNMYQYGMPVSDQCGKKRHASDGPIDSILNTSTVVDQYRKNMEQC